MEIVLFSYSFFLFILLLFKFLQLEYDADATEQKTSKKLPVLFTETISQVFLSHFIIIFILVVITTATAGCYQHAPHATLKRSFLVIFKKK